MGKISVVINTLNEEKNLPSALASVKNIADEVIVCDMYSDDKTIRIAEKAKAKVVKHKKTGYVEPARNYAISKASGDWILILDADERLGLSLRKNLRDIVKNPQADYYRIPRKNIIFGKWIKHSRWWPDYNIRFFKKGSVSWSEIIHSVPMTKGKGLDLEADEGNALVHHHYRTIEQYVTRLNRYTTIQSRELVKEGYRFNWQDLIKKPTDEFLSRYFQGEAYKDGVHGLVLSALQAFSELILYLKVWQMGEFEERTIIIKDIIEEMKDSEDNFHYWQADTLLKSSASLKLRIKRKLKLR